MFAPSAIGVEAVIVCVVPDCQLKVGSVDNLYCTESIVMIVADPLYPDNPLAWKFIETVVGVAVGELVGVAVGVLVGVAVGVTPEVIVTVVVLLIPIAVAVMVAVPEVTPAFKVTVATPELSVVAIGADKVPKFVLNVISWFGIANPLASIMVAVIVD